MLSLLDYWSTFIFWSIRRHSKLIYKPCLHRSDLHSSGKKIISCPNFILRCHRGNLQRRLHHAGRMFWRISYLMYYKHPKIFDPQSSIAPHTEVVGTIWQDRHLIPLKHLKYFSQSSFTRPQSVFTTWRKIYLHTLGHPKTFQFNLKPRLHRSGLHGPIHNPPHAATAPYDAILAIFRCDYSTQAA